MKSHILFFTGSQERTGGTERVCADITSGLVDDFNIEILSVFNGKRSAFSLNKKVKLNELFSKEYKGYIFQLMVSFKLFFYIVKSKPDFVVCVESLIFINTLLLFLLPKRPYIICWEHFNSDVDLGVKLRNTARYLASKYADKIIVLTDEDKNLWIKKYSHSSNKITRIYNPNPFENIKYKKSENKSSRNIIAVGRLAEQKGFDLLIRAWNLIPNDIRLNWNLRIIGEGTERKKLEKLISENKLEESVNLLGHIHNVEDEYKNAEIYVLSSRFEGFGLVLLEAQSYFLPVISFKCPAGPSEIVINNINGFLVEKENLYNLAESIIKLIEDDNLRKQFSKNSFKSLLKFNKIEILQEWKNILKKGLKIK